MFDQTKASLEIVRLLPTVAMNLRLAALFDLETADLTANQVLTLLVVTAADGGRMKTGEIANRLEISFPAATALVDRLVVAGVFARSQGEDRRVVWISVTESGQGLVSRLRTGLASRIEAALEAMDAPEQEQLIEALHRVAAFSQRMGELPPARGASAMGAGLVNDLPP